LKGRNVEAAPSFTEHHADSDGTAEPEPRPNPARDEASRGSAVLRTGSAEGPLRGRLPAGGRPPHCAAKVRT
jgi:hypothetical protein